MINIPDHLLVFKISPLNTQFNLRQEMNHLKLELLFSIPSFLTRHIKDHHAPQKTMIFERQGRNIIRPLRIISRWYWQSKLKAMSEKQHWDALYTSEIFSHYWLYSGNLFFFIRFAKLEGYVKKIGPTFAKSSFCQFERFSQCVKTNAKGMVSNAKSKSLRLRIFLNLPETHTKFANLNSSTRLVIQAEKTNENITRTFSEKTLGIWHQTTYYDNIFLSKETCVIEESSDGGVFILKTSSNEGVPILETSSDEEVPILNVTAD